MQREQYLSEISAEQLLAERLEAYRALPYSTWEAYEFYGLEPGMDTEKAEREATKQAFLAGEVVNPQLKYPKLANPAFVEDLELAEQSLIDLKQDIDDLEADPLRRRVAADIPAHRHLEIWMLQISHRMQDGVTDEDLADYAEMFNMINDSVYGPLEADRFAGLFGDVQNSALTVLSTDAPAQVKEAAEYIISNTGEVDQKSAKRPIIVSDETLENLRQLIATEYADILAAIPEVPEGHKFGVEELAEMFRKAHEARQTGWQTKVEPSKDKVDSRQSEKTTYIGEDKLPVDIKDAAAVLLHENGIHVERRTRGDKSGDALLGGVGLAGYLDAEEGAATIVEQIIAQKQRIAGSHYYITLGLARGLDGMPARDFRDVFELFALWSLF